MDRAQTSLFFLAACIAVSLWLCASRAATGVRESAFLGSGSGVLSTDWSQRVVANGGALPTNNTINAMETFRVGLISAGLTNKIYSLCVFVPDSVIAATTPLIKHIGSDPWTNNAFAATNLDVNGLKGDGISKFLDTGIIAKQGQGANSLPSTNLGITAIVTESITNAATVFVENQQFLGGGAIYAIALAVGGSGLSQYFNGLVTAAGNPSTNDFLRVGYLSGNSITTNQSLYVASPVESHKLLATAVNVDTGFRSGLSFDTSTIAVFAHRQNGTNAALNSTRASLVCLHEAFTQSESSNFWVLARACRASLGGGTGNPVHEWNTRLGNNAVSVNTSNALSIFRQGLDTDGLLYKMISVNPLVPDNLTAARQPIWVQAGLLIWTNVLFGETNLTINGLTGNGGSANNGTNKYLGTGLNPAGITYAQFGSSNAGISILTYASTTNGVNDLAGGGTSASSDFAIANDPGFTRFYCWKVVNVNTNFLVRALPSNPWTGYLSGDRTASNAFAIYWVTNSVHNVATNSTVLETSGTPTITNMYAFAGSSPGLAASGFSDHTLSFIALHAGLTQTESSNLWYRVATLRTNLGGGVP